MRLQSISFISSISQVPPPSRTVNKQHHEQRHELGYEIRDGDPHRRCIYCGFLSGSSSLGHQEQLQRAWRQWASPERQQTYSQGAKGDVDHIVRSQKTKLKLCSPREKLCYETQSTMSPGNLFLVIVAVLTYASAVSVSEHMYQFYISHSPLLQLCRLDEFNTCYL